LLFKHLKFLLVIDYLGVNVNALFQIIEVLESHSLFCGWI